MKFVILVKATKASEAGWLLVVREDLGQVFLGRHGRIRQRAGTRRGTPAPGPSRAVPAAQETPTGWRRGKRGRQSRRPKLPSRQSAPWVLNPTAIQPTTCYMEPEATPVLCLTCPQCRVTFPSALRVGPEVFERMTVQPTVEQCRACGTASRYEGRDYYFNVPRST